MTTLLDLARKMEIESIKESKVEILNQLLFEIIKLQGSFISSLRRFGDRGNECVLYKSLNLLHHFSDIKSLPKNDFVQELIEKDFLNLINDGDLRNNEREILIMLKNSYEKFIASEENIAVNK